MRLGRELARGALITTPRHARPARPRGPFPAPGTGRRKTSRAARVPSITRAEDPALPAGLKDTEDRHELATRTTILHHRDHAVAAAHALVESLAFPGAVLDERGVIRVVNRAWKTFAAAHGGEFEETGIGVDYLAVCDHAASDLDPNGARFGERLRRVLLGQLTHLELESGGPHPARGRAVRLDRLPQPMVVVTHEPLD